ncbi:MAG: calcineurin-like phosphoesterase family protein [Prevotella sp.]|nr:calcineurin-like phosphoesterase family protein [Prevotella sp.]
MNSKRKISLLVGCALLLATVAMVTLATRHREKSAPAAAPVAAVGKMVGVRKVTPKPVVKADTDSVAKPDSTVEGYITDPNGRGIDRVVVSDGYQCVTTDSTGHYAMKRHVNARFVFYSVPADCEVPTHSATDRTALFYQPLSAKRTAYNFRLRRLPMGKETNYRLIVFGDPQITNAFSPYYTGPNDNPVKKRDVERFTEETMRDVKSTIATWPASTPVYALSMGDDVQYYGGYNAQLERQIREALGSSRATVFSVIGNHDQDNKPLYKRKWEENFGPTDYSFNRGDVHYVCLNNVHFTRGTSYYSPGELSAAQLRWLYDDLRLTDHNMKVIVCYHIPLTFGISPRKGATPLGLSSEPKHYASASLKQLLLYVSTFKGGFELFCGHTHFAINHEIDYEGLHLLEHCHAAACGNIWQSNINICGTPNGYYVYDIDGTRIADSYYKGTFWSRNRQMTLFRSETSFNGETYSADWNLPAGTLVANVFNADSRWRVVAVEDGVEHEMTRLSHQGQDAFAAGYHHRYSQSVSYQFVSKRNGYLIMNHLYYYSPQSKSAVVTIVAIDPYGRRYTASSSDAVTEPFWNYAHYYNR